MKLKKNTFSNILFLGTIVLLILPVTRKPIQVFIHKGLAKISPSIVTKENQEQLTDYNWILESHNGVTYNFNDAKEEVVFINFWATWCPPCIAEMESINNLYKDYGGKVIFLLVTNEDKAIVSSFKAKNNYEFKYYRSLSQIPELFEASSIPKTYVLDKAGNIVINKTGAANWNSALVRSLLDEKMKD